MRAEEDNYSSSNLKMKWEVHDGKIYWESEVIVAPEIADIPLLWLLLEFSFNHGFFQNSLYILILKFQP